jgi:RNA polymerase primary sigma factor
MKLTDIGPAWGKILRGHKPLLSLEITRECPLFIPTSSGEYLARPIEDEFGHVQQLILLGKERGYLLYDEVNDSLPAEVNSSAGTDDLLSILERQGIEVYEDVASADVARASTNATEGPEPDLKEELTTEASLDLSSGVDTKSQDPVRIYLREMGSVPLLTREGEVVIAKRIEQGQLVVMKVITRSPIVIKELIAVGDDLREGARSIKEIVQFDDEEVTEEKLAKRTYRALKDIDRIAKLYETALKQAEKLAETRD